MKIEYLRQNYLKINSHIFIIEYNMRNYEHIKISSIDILIRNDSI